MADETITREALNRLEARANERLDALRQRIDIQLNEINRRLLDLNNSHEKAIEEKRRTDQAALQVGERSVTKAELQTWKDEVNRRLDTMAGAATARAAMLSLVVGFVVLILNLVIRYFTSK